jgi:hypothetical protein
MLPLSPEHHLTPGPLPHFMAERETERRRIFESFAANENGWCRGISIRPAECNSAIQQITNLRYEWPE